MRYCSGADVVDEVQSNVVCGVGEGKGNQVAGVLEIVFIRARSAAA